MFSFPPTLKTHQAPFLSVLEWSSCPVQQEGRVEGILGGLYLPARDLRNQTNKSPREHCDKQAWFYISPRTQNTAMHCHHCCARTSVGFPAWQGWQTQFCFLYKLPQSSNEVQDWKVKSRALQGEEHTCLNSSCPPLLPNSSKA